jgi:ankyrin repeat protein
MPPKLLPLSPHLDHLKKQAKDLLDAYKAGDVEVCALIREFHPRLTQATDAEILAADLSLSDAQLVIAREYSFLSWPKLKHFVDTYDAETISESAQRLKAAIDGNDVNEVRRLVTADPDLLNDHVRRSCKWNYVNYRPLTYACGRGLAEVARTLIELGADVHEDGDLPIARANGFPAMEVLVQNGVKLNHVFGLEDHNLDVIKWMLAHGADPNSGGGAALDLALQTYFRTNRMQACVETLIQAGAEYEDGPVFDILRGRLDLLEERLDQNPDLVHQHFTINRGMVYGGFYGGAPLTNTTLLHYCAEYNLIREAEFLLARGADVNARAKPDQNSPSDHTPVYHTVASNWNFSFPMLELFLARGADLSVKSTIRVPSFTEHSGNPKDKRDKNGRLFDGVTPLGYALRYPEPPYNIAKPDGGIANEPHQSVIELLRKHGAPE